MDDMIRKWEKKLNTLVVEAHRNRDDAQYWLFSRMLDEFRTDFGLTSFWVDPNPGIRRFSTLPLELTV